MRTFSTDFDFSSRVIGGLRATGYALRVWALLFSEAIHGVVVYQTYGLHVGIANRAADKLEAALQQVFAYAVA